MKHVFFVPVKAVSERVPNKNFKPMPQFNNAPLYQIIPLKIAKVCDELGLDYVIVMDTNSPKVSAWVNTVQHKNPTNSQDHPLGGVYPHYSHWRRRSRPEHLCNNSANGNYILREGVNWLTEGNSELYKPDNTIIWQAFVTTPLLSENTLREMIKMMEDFPWSPGPCMSPMSVMTVEEHRGFFWDRLGTPIGGYRPEVMLPSQTTPMIFKEIHGLFGIRLEEFLRLGCRTGNDPRFFRVPKEECVDIDWPEDLEKLAKTDPSLTPSGSATTSVDTLPGLPVSKPLMEEIDKYVSNKKSVTPPVGFHVLWDKSKFFPRVSPWITQMDIQDAQKYNDMMDQLGTPHPVVVSHPSIGPEKKAKKKHSKREELVQAILDGVSKMLKQYSHLLGPKPTPTPITGDQNDPR